VSLYFNFKISSILSPFSPNALINPVKLHPDVVIQAVAARNRQKAEAYAKKHNILQAIDSYKGKDAAYCCSLVDITQYWEVADCSILRPP
jgi:hypothetical protein